MFTLESPDLIALGMEADAIRRRLHPEGIVTYTLEAAPHEPALPLDEWVAFHRQAHAQGLRTTAVMSFDHLEAVRRLQDEALSEEALSEETGGFIAFVPLVPQETTAVEYLKILALSRIRLDNIPNIESSWVPADLKTRQIALRFGANDLGCTGIGQATEEDLRHIIRDAGFTPKQRDPLYRTYFLN